jgi:hypothetical protein
MARARLLMQIVDMAITLGKAANHWPLTIQRQSLDITFLDLMLKSA